MTTSDYFITVKQTEVIFSKLETNADALFTFKVYVSAGDTIDFVAGAGAVTGSDSVEVNASIQLVDYAPSCSELAANYAAPSLTIVGQNRNCRVGLEDLRTFALEWLKCNDPQGDSACHDVP